MSNIAAANDEADHFACHTCGTREHIDLLDFKAPPGHPDPDNADFTHCECVACYGPGWETNLSAEEMQGHSIAPQLKPLYISYFTDTARPASSGS